MAPVSHLPTLLASMAPRIAPDTYVFATVPKLPSRLKPIMTFREGERMTLILTLAEAEAANLPHTYSSRMITLNTHSSLEAVGFLAAVSTRLAASGISINPVSAFYHDHLFVPAERAVEAMKILDTLAQEHQKALNAAAALQG